MDSTSSSSGAARRRRRRGSSAADDARSKRMSMPMNAFSGPLETPDVNSAATGSGRGFRRGSDFMQSYLPGTARAFAEPDGGHDDASEDGSDDAEEDAYDFPWWWFIFLCLPSVPVRRSWDYKSATRS